MNAIRTTCIAAAVAALGIFAGPVLGADTVKNTCIKNMSIDQMKVVDDKTILIDLKPGDRYMRVDMANVCTGMKFSGFVHNNPADEFCRTDVLTVQRSQGATCMIAQMTEISASEADTLRMQK